MEKKKGISLINSFHFNFNCFYSHACSFVSRLSFSQRYYFSLHLNLNVFFINQKKCFLKNDFDSQAKALEALKTAEKISRPNPFWAESHALRGMDVELV